MKFFNNNKPYTFDRVVRIIIGLSVIVLIYLLILRLSDVLLPFVIGFMLAYYLNPIVLFFQKKLRIKNRGLAIFFTLFLFVIVFGGISWLVIPQMITEFQKFGALLSNYSHNVNLGTFFPPEWQAKINEFISSININELLKSDNFTATLKEVFPKLWSFVNGSIAFLLGLIVIAFVFMYMIFILIDYEKIKSGMAEMVPQKYKAITFEVSADIKHAVNQYFRGQGLVSLITGILLIIGFLIIGLPMAIAMGALMGLMCMVPYLHGFGLIPAAILGVLKAQETGQNIWLVWLSILIVFVVVQVIQDYILVPRIMKKVMGLRPAIVLLSLSIWGSLLGFIGLIMALPLTVVIVEYYKRFILDEDKKTDVVTKEIKKSNKKET